MNRAALIDVVRTLLPLSVAGRLPDEVKIISVSEATARRLNVHYRKKSYIPNVLSFRFDDTYGEIILCPAVIRREAREQMHSYQFQMTWMIVHGMLHLSQMHHEESEAAQWRVKRLEEKILKYLGI